MLLEPILDKENLPNNQPLFCRTQIYEFQCPTLRFNEFGKADIEYVTQQIIALEFYELS